MSDTTAEWVMQKYNNAERRRRPLQDKWDRWYKCYCSATSDEEDRAYASNLFIPKTFEHVETTVPRVLQALFAQSPLCDMVALAAEDQKAVDLVSRRISYIYEAEMPMIVKAAPFIREALIYGTAFCMHPWTFTEEPEPVPSALTGYERIAKVAPTVTYRPRLKGRQGFVHCDLYDVYIPDYGHDMDTLPYLIYVVSVELPELRRLQAAGVVNGIDDIAKQSPDVPDEEKKSVRSDVTGIEEPSSSGQAWSEKDERRRYLVYEYWEDKKTIWVCKNTTIRNAGQGGSAKYPYPHGKMPFSAWRPVTKPHEFYGVGYAEVLEHLQYELNDDRNQLIDAGTMNLNNMWLVGGSTPIRSTELVSRMGGVIHCNRTDDIVPLRPNPPSQSAYEIPRQVEQDMQNALGLTPLLVGAPAAAPAGETVGAVNAKIAEANQRFAILIQTAQVEFVNRMVAQTHANIANLEPADEMAAVLGEQGRVWVSIPVGDRQKPARYLPKIMPGGASQAVWRMQLMQLWPILQSLPFANQMTYFKELLRAYDIRNIAAWIQEPPPMPAATAPAPPAPMPPSEGQI